MVRQCRWKLRCESTNHGSTGSPTVVDVIPGLTRNLWKVGGGLIQTLNQVQGDVIDLVCYLFLLLMAKGCHAVVRLGSPTVVRQAPQPWWMSFRAPTRNLWKVGVGLIQTLNQVQGDGLRLWVTDCVQGDRLRLWVTGFVFG